MMYRGHVRNGVVVLDDGPPLAEGTAVRVEVPDDPQSAPRPGSVEAVLSNPARWEGTDEEAEALLQELRHMKSPDPTLVRIRFPDLEAKRRALGSLPGRFSFKSWASGEMRVPRTALAFLAAEGIEFIVEE